ncbi:hypothetical protein M3Y97_00315900 [Aphelenchoides bicaudatus]|nr:hypothetical protein M3Y97_00315900 [Aphelenchoides bicaudatus]
MQLFLSILFLAGSFVIVNGAECYYCATGATNDILKLVEVYGDSEIKSGAFAQSTRVYDQECGKNSKKTLKGAITGIKNWITGTKQKIKTVKCPNGCVFAEYIDKAAFAGCARDGMLLKSVSAYQVNEQQYRMATCSNDECNENYESASKDRPKPSEAPTTALPSTTTPSSTTPQILEANVTNQVKDSLTTTDHPKSTVKPKGKPNSAVSVGLSLSTLFVGLVAYLLL